MMYSNSTNSTSRSYSMYYNQWWGKIYLILNILNKYRTTIIICRMGYLFIYIIPK